MVVYLILFGSIIVYEIFPNLYFPKILNNEIVYISLAVVILPAFLILPGIIYDGNYRTRYLWMTFDEYEYWFFITITFGLGPVFIFFKKYDPMLKMIHKTK